MRCLSMKNSALVCFAMTLLLLAVFLAPSVHANGAGPAVDDFSDPEVNDLGFPRIFVTDQSVGGQSSIVHTIENGVIEASGAISPPRGQLGWASIVLLLEVEGEAMDASAFDGIRMSIRIKTGNLSVSANSSEITNFDYHAAQVKRQSGEGFHEVRIPFSSMRRAWSETTPLNPATLASISLVAWDIQPGGFDYEVDDLGFY